MQLRSSSSSPQSHTASPFMLPLLPSSIRYNTHRMPRPSKSQFIQQVKDQITRDSHYQYMDSKKISAQQQNLKSLLRQINHQTQEIMSKVIQNEGLTKMKEKKGRSMLEIKHVRDRQVQNKNKIIAQCQHEMSILESRCQNLKYLTREQMQKEILSVREQISSLRVSNKDMVRGVTLAGLNICRGQKSNDIKEMEGQKVLLQRKKDKLASESESQDQQIEDIKKKIEELSIKEAVLQAECKSVGVQPINVDKLKEEQKEKQRAHQSLSNHMAIFASTRKHRYLHLLKQLQQVTGNSSAHTAKQKDLDSSLTKSREELAQFEKRLSQLKAKRSKVIVNL